MAYEALNRANSKEEMEGICAHMEHMHLDGYEITSREFIYSFSDLNNRLNEFKTEGWSLANKKSGHARTHCLSIDYPFVIKDPQSKETTRYWIGALIFTNGIELKSINIPIKLLEEDYINYTEYDEIAKNKVTTMMESLEIVHPGIRYHYKPYYKSAPANIDYES